jgi:hypothetical protein
MFHNSLLHEVVIKLKNEHPLMWKGIL